MNRLSIKSNNISGEGLCAIADCLKYNSTLNKIYIWGNNLEESACIVNIFQVYLKYLLKLVILLYNLLKAFSNLIKIGRISQDNTDVRAYEVDNVTYLSELSNGINMFYYWQPKYGDLKNSNEIME